MSDIHTKKGTLWSYPSADEFGTIGLGIEIEGGRIDMNLSLDEAERYVRDVQNTIAYARWMFAREQRREQ